MHLGPPPDLEPPSQPVSAPALVDVQHEPRPKVEDVKPVFPKAEPKPMSALGWMSVTIGILLVAAWARYLAQVMGAPKDLVALISISIGSWAFLSGCKAFARGMNVNG